MHSNFRFSIKPLKGGRFLLCDGEGAPVCVDHQGRIRLTPAGKPMIVSPEIAAQHRAQQLEPYEKGKVPLEDYTKVASVLFAPQFNIRANTLEFHRQTVNEERFENIKQEIKETFSLNVNKGDFQSAIRFVARENEYDPVADWLNSLDTERTAVLTDEEWQAIARIALGAEGEFEGEVLRKFLIALVARPLQPSCKVDFCLLIHGDQGLGKSTFFKALAGEWFSDSMGNLDNLKDDLAILHGAWLCEWSEADAVFQGANKSEGLKRFISRTDDAFRLPYARNTVSRPRRSLLCGTTNRSDFISDPTGNRRFPVIAAKEMNVAWVEKHRERIIGRALVEFRKGTPWWFSREQEAEITQRAEQFAPESQYLNTALEVMRAEPDRRWNTKELMVRVAGKDPDQISTTELRSFGREMQRLLANGVRVESEAYIPRDPRCGAKGRHKVFSLRLAS